MGKGDLSKFEILINGIGIGALTYALLILCEMTKHIDLEIILASGMAYGFMISMIVFYWRQ